MSGGGCFPEPKTIPMPQGEAPLTEREMEILRLMCKHMTNKEIAAELVRRVNSQETFPHEIGLFLGYPSEDVNGFIKYGADKAKCVGAWRVYGDEEAAKKKFALYKKCTRVYKDAYRRHNSFERLVINGAR